MLPDYFTATRPVQRAFVLLVGILMLTLRIAHAVPIIPNCLIDSYGYQYNLNTGEFLLPLGLYNSYYSPSLPPLIEVNQTAIGLWQLRLVNRGESNQDPLKSVPLDATSYDRVELVPGHEIGAPGELPDPYFALHIIHPDNSLDLEIYERSTFQRRGRIENIYLSIDCYHQSDCTQWDFNTKRAAFIFVDRQQNAPTLALLALDRGTSQRFNLTKLSAKYGLPLVEASERLAPMRWSPDGQSVAFLTNSNAEDPQMLALHVFGLDGWYQLNIDNHLRQQNGGEGYIYQPFFWVNGGRSLLFSSYTSFMNSEGETGYFQNLAIYHLRERKLAQLAKLPFHPIFPEQLSPTGTQIMVSWGDEFGVHGGIIDLTTGQRKILIDDPPGYMFFHWRDTRFAWIETERNDLVWYDLDQRVVHKLTFGGESTDYGGGGLQDFRQLPPQFIWNNRMMTYHTSVPDKQTISREQNSNLYTTWLIDLKTGITQVMARERYRTDVSPSPDGQSLVILPEVISNGIDGILIDAPKLRLIKRDQTKTEVVIPFTGKLLNILWSLDGRLLFYDIYSNQTGMRSMTILENEGHQLNFSFR